METSIEIQSGSVQTPWTASLPPESAAPIGAAFIASAIAVAMANAAFRALLKVNRKRASLTRRPRVIGPEDVTEILST
jgi:hypothetical protein